MVEQNFWDRNKPKEEVDQLLISARRPRAAGNKPTIVREVGKALVSTETQYKESGEFPEGTVLVFCHNIAAEQFKEYERKVRARLDEENSTSHMIILPAELSLTKLPDMIEANLDNQVGQVHLEFAVSSAHSASIKHQMTQFQASAQRCDKMIRNLNSEITTSATAIVNDDVVPLLGPLAWTADKPQR